LRRRPGAVDLRGRRRDAVPQGHRPPPGRAGRGIVPIVTDTEEPPLAELPDDWARALAVMAHPDDMEYGGAAAVARWTAEGKHVAYLLVTKGEAGIDSMDPDDARRVRVAEQIDSARVVGVEAIEFLDHPDGMIEPGLTL